MKNEFAFRILKMILNRLAIASLCFGLGLALTDRAHAKSPGGMRHHPTPIPNAQQPPIDNVTQDENKPPQNSIGPAPIGVNSKTDAEKKIN